MILDHMHSSSIITIIYPLIHTPVISTLNKINPKSKTLNPDLTFLFFSINPHFPRLSTVNKSVIVIYLKFILHSWGYVLAKENLQMIFF